MDIALVNNIIEQIASGQNTINLISEKVKEKASTVLYSIDKLMEVGLIEKKNCITEEKNKKKMLLKLFLSTLYLSAFTFGGGYVIVTLMKKKFVDQYHWIEENEMLDLVAIAQSSPGAIAVNGAIVVGSVGSNPWDGTASVCDFISNICIL